MLPAAKETAQSSAAQGGPAAPKDIAALDTDPPTSLDDPSEFRLDRGALKPMAFGFGAHVCLIQHLARLEMRYLPEELLPRPKTLELTSEPARSHSTFVTARKRLPIRFAGLQEIS